VSKRHIGNIKGVRLDIKKKQKLANKGHEDN
jgi:hypothetical protein